MSENSDIGDRTPELLRWSVAQRLAFIDLRLYWEGAINRSDLVDQFSISVPQASADLARYLALAPDNLTYDQQARQYSATPGFTPKFGDPDARKYLTQLLMVADQGLDQRTSWLGSIPSHDVLPRVRRRLDAATLRRVVDAIHHKKGLSIQYQSMNYDEPAGRWVDPHALVFDGYRWHMRVWCHKRSRFADFVLARVLQISDDRPRTSDPTLDREWNEIVIMKIAPLPSLSLAQRRAIERDYGMEDGRMEVKMRLCLTYYFERHFNLDIDPQPLEPGRIQLIWTNREEIEQLRSED